MKLFSKEKIVPYLLVLIFVAFFLYIIFSYIICFIKGENAVFQIKRGSIRESISTKGFIYRNEVLVKNKEEGFVLYVYKDKSKVSRNDVVLISSKKEFANIKNDDELSTELELAYDQIYDEANDYIYNIDNNNFFNTYNAINDINEYIKDYDNDIENFADVNDFKDKKAVKTNTRDAGIISYNIDGYEDLKIEDYNENLLYAKNHRKLNRKAYLDKDEVACKIIRDLNYKVVFDASNRLDDFVNNKKRIKVYIKNIDKYIETKIETLETIDGKKHYVVSLNKYLDKLLDTRVVDMDIVCEERVGLKVTNNCIYTRNCIAIDKNFIFYDEVNDEYYVNKIEDNREKKININITYQDDENAYILYEKNKSKLNINDKITKNNNIYNISKIKSYKGVMCLNKGYEVFRIINIICENNEYSIIKEEPGSLLKVYDMILVNVDI